MESPTILMVEDDAGLSTMLMLALEHARYTVQIAANGVEALDALSRTQPALILLDLRMPVMDGPTFLQIAQQRYGDALPPVILMTAYREIDDEVRQLGLPLLHKPMDIDQLLQLIRARTH